MEKKITELYAFVVTNQDGQEGVMCFLTKEGTMMPMVGADLNMVDKLRSLAKAISDSAKVEYKILHFELIGEIEK